MTNKEWQKVYDGIKNVRENAEGTVTIHGKTYKLKKWEQPAGYWQVVLCKYNGGRTIGVQTIYWKDAGPNPRLSSGEYIKRKHIYALVV